MGELIKFKRRKLTYGALPLEVILFEIDALIKMAREIGEFKALAFFQRVRDRLVDEQDDEAKEPK